MTKERLVYLLEKHFAKKCSPAEKEELARAIAELKDDKELSEWMEQKWNSFLPHESVPAEESEIYFRAILDETQKGREVSTAEPVRIGGSKWWRAAAIVLVLVTGSYFWFNNSHHHPDRGSSEIKKNDVFPGGNHAVLTLSDGSRLVVDSVSNGLLAEQGNTKIIKLSDGQVAYDNAGETSGVLYNTLSTPVGGQYRITLPDGTAVWLNAASSITYPTAFTGKEREVSITGEVYFEVKQNRLKPFRVKVKEQVIEVLGTHFNVNAYGDDNTTKTTLAEGSVKIVGKKGMLLLRPNQQGQLDKNGKLELIPDPDMEETLAWKNGLFHFNGTGIDAIMKQVSRWYDVNIVYKDKIEEEFVADIPRNVNVSKLLELLELTRQVHFEVEGKTITVMR